VSVAAALAGGKDQQSALPPPGVRTAYKFDEAGPHFQAFGLLIRNPEKSAPLIACGRNTGGEIAVTVPDLGKMGFMAGDKALDKLTDTAMKASGRFSAETLTYGGPRWAKVDPNRYACAEWLNRETKPKVAIKIDSMTDWHPAKDAGSGNARRGRQGEGRRRSGPERAPPIGRSGSAVSTADCRFGSEGQVAPHASASSVAGFWLISVAAGS
jgi:hypothetical protein